jgi:hypothetical protein
VCVYVAHRRVCLSLLTLTNHYHYYYHYHCHHHNRVIVAWCISDVCNDIVDAANAAEMLKPGIYSYIFSDGISPLPSDWTDNDILRSLVGSFYVAPAIPESADKDAYDAGWAGSGTVPLPNYAYYARDAAAAMLAAFEALKEEESVSTLSAMSLASGRCIPPAGASETDLLNDYTYASGATILAHLHAVQYVV